MGFLRHEPCPKCGSENNFSRYEDGGGNCEGHSCDYYEKKGTDIGEIEAKPVTTGSVSLPPLGDFLAVTPRGISEETCRKMRYSTGSYSFINKESGQRVTKKAHLVNVADQNGIPVALKVRMAGKDFRYVGETKRAGLVFQDVWKAGSSRKIVITEGEIDALSVSQVQGNKYAVVSLPNGTKSAVEVCGRSRDYLNSFEEIIVMFDMDEPGKEAAQEMARLFGSKVKIAELPEKDANECLKQGKGKEIISAIFNAQHWKPEGVVTLSSLRDAMKQQVVRGRDWCYDQLTKLTYGRRYGELYFIGAGAGIGKTDFMLQQIEFDLSHMEKSSLFLLEQPVVETGKRLAGKRARKRFHIPEEDGEYTQEELDAAIDALVDSGDCYLYDHFGSKNWDTIKDTIRWLCVTNGVRNFYVDHLTALVAGADNEKEELERITAEMSGLCQELDINLYVVSHLATPQGTPHEEGGRVMMRHFKGSRAIGFWGHFMFGLERNTQAENQFVRRTTIFRVVKDRYTGQANGETFLLGYEVDAGIQYELSDEECEQYADAVGSDSKKENNYGQDF